MGFFDSLNGIGRAIGGALESVAQTVLPVFAQAGTQFLLQKAFPGQSASLPFGVPPIRFPQGDRPRAPFPGELPFGTPPIAPRQLPTGVFGRQTSQFPVFDPFSRGPGAPPPFFPTPTRTTIPQLPILPGGRQVAHFPTSQDVSGVSPVGFNIPGIDLQLPFRTEPGGIGCPSLFRTGGMSARPVSMFMVPNPVSARGPPDSFLG